MDFPLNLHRRKKNYDYSSGFLVKREVADESDYVSNLLTFVSKHENLNILNEEINILLTISLEN